MIARLLVVATVLVGTAGACRDRTDRRDRDHRTISDDGSARPREASAAETAARRAVDEAAEAQHRVEKLSTELANLDAEVDRAAASALAATTDAERSAARSALDKLRRDHAELAERVAAAKATAAKTERAAGAHDR